MVRLGLAFFAIYFIWGSTYLAIRYAVEGIPPLFTAGARSLAAGVVLYTWARLRGHRVSWREWRSSLIVGALFFLAGHGSLHWAEQVVPSGLAALLVATEPIWIAILMATSRRRERLGTVGLVGLLAGVAGVGVLMGGSLVGSSAELWGSAAVLLGTFSWAVGVRYCVEASLPANSLMRAATTLLSGAALLLLAGALAGEASGFELRAVPARSLAGLAYLAIFGSIIAFTAYSWLLERCSPTLVATHTFVNPVVAVLLGWAIAAEPLTGRLIAATALILVAVALINAGTRERQPARAQQEPSPAGTLPRPARPDSQG